MKEAPDQYYDRQPEPHKSICLKLRELILKTIPGVEEDYKWGSPTYALNGVNILYVANASKTHATLGFMFGAHIDDPYGLIEGTGANLRHIKFRSLEEIDEPKVAALLEAASKTRAPSAQ